MCRAARAILETLGDCDPLTAAGIVEQAGTTHPNLSPANVRRRIYELLGLGALQRGGRQRFHITPAGDAVLARIYGEDPELPAFPRQAPLPTIPAGRP